MEFEIKGITKSSFETKFAKVVSHVFHPLLMPSYGFALILLSENYISILTPSNLKILLLSVTFIFTFFLPTINALVLLKMGRIKTLEMTTSEERIVPYGSAVLYYFALFYLLHQINFPDYYKVTVINFLNRMNLGAAISIALILIINFRWKISAHMIGVGGLTGATLGMMYRLQIDFRFILMAELIGAGLIAFARLKLQVHTPSQVYLGFVVGFLVELLPMLF